MLKLKRVEIQGFKSFYEKTEMKFHGSGIAAVVGPNGCGKSNLSDAVSWVLGEQSAKTLRGARMEDVIFAGTRDKKPLSMASVTITMVPDQDVITPIHLGLPGLVEGGHSALDNLTGDGEPEPQRTPIRADVFKAAEQRGEVTITRRLFRSGDSEYLINGRAARLRDIQELFLGTGLGPESYAIIEQGRIGQILSNKPQDRRNVIEEAAGVTKFKTRKRLAEARLESAKQNLSRVFDILEEVTRQVNSLKRQAAKTKRYGELRQEAAEVLRQVLGAKFRTLERDSAKVAIELNLASSELHAAQATILDLEQQQAARAEQSRSTGQELTSVRQELADLQLQAERARAKVEYQARQVEQIDLRLHKGAQEVQSIEQEKQTRVAELEQQSRLLQQVNEQVLAAGKQLHEKADYRQTTQAALTIRERGLEAIRQQVLRLLNESSASRNRMTQVEAQLATADRDTGRARNDEQQSTADLERLQRVKTQISERLQSRQTELLSLTANRTEVEQELARCRAHLAGTRQSLDRARAEHSRVKARRDSLEGILQHRSYTTETVKRLFQTVDKNRSQGLKPVGVLADFLEVDAHIEKAAEEFLHDELEYVVVNNWSGAETGIELMRGEVGGRATFLVESQAAPATQAEIGPRPDVEDGRVWKLSDSLRLTNGLTGLPLRQLPRLEHCYVAVERSLARKLAPEFPHCWFLTPDGVSYQGHTVTGGKKSGAGPLALKRELRELTEIESRSSREVTEAQVALAELEGTIQKLTHQLDSLRTQQQTQEKDVLALDHESRKLAEEFQRVQTRLSNARLELDRIRQDRGRLDESLHRDRTAHQAAEQQRHEQETALEHARAELSGLQNAVAQASEEHANLRATLASLEERQRSIASHRLRLENQLGELGRRLLAVDQEKERSLAERVHLLASSTELVATQFEQAGLLENLDTSAARLSQLESEHRRVLTLLEEQLKQLRQAADARQECRSGLQVALARAESDLQHLEETAHRELDTTLKALSGEDEKVLDEQTLLRLEESFTDLRRKIEALGPVNPQALEEYGEAEGRQAFLTAQRQDLLDSIRDTEKAIHEIDGESRKRFLEAFNIINANFREMFQTLFGGGTGEMRLTDEDNASESGIDIVASPPGKKLQSVLLLSGGEKSLTAMALLMGIFQYTPSPFCILDEVDAPLDEPNIERLTRLIREMSERTQFIVITHSKRTMEAAQSLYGVTMQEPGVSKLVSVKFEVAGSEPTAKAGRLTFLPVPDLEPTLVS